MQSEEEKNGGFFCLLFMDKVKALLPDFQRCWEFAAPFEPGRSCKRSEPPQTSPPCFRSCVLLPSSVYFWSGEGGLKS